MCRMMGIMAPRGADPEIVAAFRQQARGEVPPGDTPGHADGWGILYYEGDKPTYAGRSTGDAATDPRYDIAVEDLRKRRPAGPLLAHVRKASAGALSVENTHPFTMGRWSFCHNGTVWGFAPEGQSDSRALFAALHDDIARGTAPLAAIRHLAEEIDCLKYTSLTFLLTDGRTIWALRKVGNVNEECLAGCSPDHYTLGVARIGDQTVIAQETGFLALGASPWQVVPDAHVAIVGPDGHVRIVAL